MKKLNHSILGVDFMNDFRSFVKGDKFEFIPGINLLCGDNGCGKSSLMWAIMKSDNKDIRLNISPKANNQFYFFDAEKHNPRTVSNINDSHMSVGTILGSRFGSHGETILPLVEAMVKAKNVVLFLDEPESGLSIRSQYRILESINKAKNNGCQIFIATHSAILINSVDKVLSLEHKKWMNSGDFICSQE